ncbi:MAG: magnesium chelatase [Acidobacteriota bacterium]
MSGWTERARRSVRDELRINLIARVERREVLFPGIVGYDDTVIPQIVNAILSRHHFILLGLRGQAKSRILREIRSLLDEEVPAVAGCEIHDDPAAPICRRCRDTIAELGDATPVAWIGRDERYLEKLATPDVTIADIIGDMDPIRAARGGLNLSDELTIHYGLLPRAHRGIFAVNELPDLAPKIQVGLFNILQEGDVQIKGYPVRLPLDVLLVFTANPEDYTARGKIITPLKDRIGSEIRTHYPLTLESAMEITNQEAYTDRRADGGMIRIAPWLREVIDEIAILARRDRRVDKRSGVSQRLPITVLENVVSNAERRALLTREKVVVPRIADLYAAMPAMTGKLELEYEGEMKGAEQIAGELVRAAVGLAFRRHYGSEDLSQVVDWFERGGYLKLPDLASSDATLAALQRIDGLLSHLRPLGVVGSTSAAERVAAAELILEGLAASSKISRSEERGYGAARESRAEVGREAPEHPPSRDPDRRRLN